VKRLTCRWCARRLIRRIRGARFALLCTVCDSMDRLPDTADRKDAA
jgi:hypothetical protein